MANNSLKRECASLRRLSKRPRNQMLFSKSAEKDKLHSFVLRKHKKPNLSPPQMVYFVGCIKISDDVSTFSLFHSVCKPGDFVHLQLIIVTCMQITVQHFISEHEVNALHTRSIAFGLNASFLCLVADSDLRCAISTLCTRCTSETSPSGGHVISVEAES